MSQRITKQYGLTWQNMKDEERWKSFHYNQGAMHQKFHDWFELNPHDTVLEVGCGYGEQARITFVDHNYTGIDLSGVAIDLAVSKTKDVRHEFISADVMNHKLPTYDLVFSINVIDHVEDPNAFIDRLISLAKKTVLIYAYNGYYPNVENHVIAVNGTGDCYLNKLSVKELKRRFDCKCESLTNNHTIVEIPCE